MNLVKFSNSYYKPFVTNKEVTVDLVLDYFKENYEPIGRYVKDPDYNFDNLSYIYDELNNDLIEIFIEYIKEIKWKYLRN